MRIKQRHSSKKGISLIHDDTVDLDVGNYIIESNFNSQKTKLFSTIEFSVYNSKSKKLGKKLLLPIKIKDLKNF